MEDERCCGTGTCIINPEGYCWCGQKWDGQKMSFPDSQTAEHATPHERSHAATTSAAEVPRID
jgi:hypothetical protein